MPHAIQHYLKRLESLRTERTSFDSHWRELSDNILASRGRYQVTDRNKGHKRNTKQYNNTGRRAARSLSAGMMAGMSSPARPWFRLGTHNRALREVGSVKRWLKSVQDLLFAIFSESNFYNTLALTYQELGTFGTGPMAIYADFENVIRCQQFTVGSYFLGVNGHGIVDSFYREYQLQVGALVTQFGIENVSVTIQNLWRAGTTEAWVDVIHVVEPNDDRDQQRIIGNRGMSYRSVYFEKKEKDNNYLKSSGFEEFPIMAPRWQTTAEDTYATECPGMTALGDVKALQIQERKKAQAIDKLVDPPLQAPAQMKGRRISLIPGDTSYVDALGPGGGIEPIYEIRPDLQAMAVDINQTERRIDQAYFVDLFLMFTNIGDRERVTQEEIIRKNEEKLLMLGPMLQSMRTELFDPAIDRTFNLAFRAGIVPEPPPELREQELEIQYISPLFQAQKAIGAVTIERFTAFVSTLAQGNPSVMDKYDADQAVDEYADAIGVNPNIVLTDDEAEDVRADRAAAQRAAQQAAAVAPGAQAAKDLSEADTSGKNLLTDGIERVRQAQAQQ